MEEKKEIASGIANKRNRYVFLVLNLVFTLYVFFHNPTLLGALVVAFLNIFLVVTVLNKKRSSRYALCELGTFLLADLVIMTGVNLNDIIVYQKQDLTESFGFNVSSPFLLIGLIIVGLALFILGLSGVLNPIGATLILVGFIYKDYGYSSAPYFSRTGLLILVLSVALYWVWYYLSVLIRTVDSNCVSDCKRISIGLIVFQVAMIKLEKDFIVFKLGELLRFFGNAENDFLPWWKLLIFEVVLVCAAISVYLNSGKNKTDFLMTSAIAFFPLMLSILVNAYFTYNILMALFFGAILYECISHEASGTKGFRYGNIALLTTAMAGFPIIVFLTRRDLLGVVLVTLVFMILYHLKFDDIKEDLGSNLFWLCVLCNIFLETVAFVSVKKSSLHNISILTVAFIFSVVTLYVINWPHPSKKKAPVYMNIVICVCFALICLMPVIKYGIHLNLTVKSGTASEFVLKRKDKAKSGGSVLYYWNDQGFKRTSEDTVMEGSQMTIPVESEMLVVKALDKHGVTTNYRYWYPKAYMDYLQNTVDELSSVEKKYEKSLSKSYSIDVLSQDVPEDSPVSFKTPSVGEKCTISYECDEAFTVQTDASTSDNLSVRIISRANVDYSRYFNILVDGEKKTITVKLRLIPDDNFFTLIVDCLAADGKPVSSSEFSLIAGMRDSVLTLEKNYEVKDGLYAFKNREAKKSLHLKKDSSIDLTKDGSWWRVEKSRENHYKLTKYNGEKMVYLHATPTNYSPLYVSKEPFDSWVISEFWIPGKGKAFGLAIDMDDINKDGGSFSLKGYYYLDYQDKELRMISEKETNSSCVWSVKKKEDN